MRHPAPLLPSSVKAMFIVVASLLILVIRRPDAFLNPQFWAEDFFFLLDAEKMGVSAFVMPRGGYLHLLPRAIAWFATYLDPVVQPGFFVGCSVFVTLAIMFQCVSARHALPFKLWMATAVLVVPHSGEVFLTPTNLQWIAALALPLIAIKADPAKRLDWFADVALLVFAGLSGPFVIFALPIFVFRARRRRTQASLVVLAIALLCAMIQGWFVAHAPPDREFVGEFSLFDLLAGVSHRIAGNLLIGVYAGSISKLITMLLGAAVAGFVGAAVYSGPRQRTELVVLLSFVALLLVSATLRKRFDLWAFSSMESGDRYFFLPKVVLLWVLGVVIANHRAFWFKWTAVVLVLLGMFLNAPRFAFFPYRDLGWYAKCPKIRAGELVYLEINPDWKFRYRRGSLESFGPLR